MKIKREGIEKSKYSVFFDKPEGFYIFNTLYGTLDLLDENIKDCILKNDYNTVPSSDLDKLIKRGHVNIEKDEEIERLFLKSERERKKKNIFYLVFSYDCNLNCSYCFEKNINSGESFDEEKLNNLFKVILEIYKKNKRETQLVLYGGEPFLFKNRFLIEKVIEFSQEHNFSIRAITNGTNIENYLPFFEKYKNPIECFNITIDGSKKNHDSRRPYINNKGSYDDIIDNINLLISKNCQVKVRINIDKTTGKNIKKSINELDMCLNNIVEKNIYLVEDNSLDGNISDELYTLPELCKHFLSEENLELFNREDIKFRVKSFSQIIKNLLEPEFTRPLFKNCNLDEIITCSPDGNLYFCAESCEDSYFHVANYHPNQKIYWNKFFDFTKITTFDIEYCKNCALAPLCGGGCPLKRKNYYTKKNGQHFCCYEDIIKSLEYCINKFIQYKFI